MRRLTALAIAVACLVVPGVAHGAFGLSEADVTFTNADGSPVTQAGSHPFAMATKVVFNTKIDPKFGELTDERLKDIVVEQLPGLVGDATVMPRCSTPDFVVTPVACKDDAAVGYSQVTIALREGNAPQTLSAPVYNLVPAPGEVARLGFHAAGLVPTFLEIVINPDPPHNLIAYINNNAEITPIYGSTVTLWGNPSDPAHDPYRGNCLYTFAATPTSTGLCPVSRAGRPFLTVPRACGHRPASFETDSWEHPGAWVSGQLGSSLQPEGFSGCEKLGFHPTIGSQPTTKAAVSPTGLDFSLNVADEGLTNPNGIAGADISKTVVSLPEGMTANPSLAEGLEVCTQEELARETASSVAGEGCPDASKIGTAEVQTPLLEERIEGSLYMAKPYENPFGSLLAMYLVLKNPQYGLVIKQPLELVPDPATGRLTAIAEDLPELPYSQFKLHFREGARSPLASPPACGTYDTEAILYPSSGGAPVKSTSPFQIITGPEDGPCPAGGVPPFKPGLIAGTQSNTAGSYSPFYLRITRSDSEQEITKFSTVMPSGLSGNLTGIPFCPDSAIQAARGKTGQQELASPSCPPASEIGHSIVGAGVGTVLAQTPGKVYLAGPYHGSALSIVSVTSATVGPFDLGTVVIRFALRINPITAQVEIDSTGSDPIPHIIDGIVVHVRDIHVYVDRQHFILNPTSCNPMSVANAVTGTGASIANPADDATVVGQSRFQAAECANLAFKPSFKASTSGKTSRLNGAGLHVALTYPKNALGKDANIRSVKVSLPKQLPSRLSTLQQACTDSVFAANPAACPAASRVGTAKAITPILPVPLEGPAYFVSHGGSKWPELILVLQGYGVTIDLHGETFINKGITSSTFAAVPDQPVSSFELSLPQGPNSALAAPYDLCAIQKTVTVRRKVTSRSKSGAPHTVVRKLRKRVPGVPLMPTVFTAQNGRVVRQNTPIEVTGCSTHLHRRHKSTRARK